MNFFVIIGVLSVFLINGNYALEYSLLENLEMSCSPLDNCALGRSASFENRTCECDHQCHYFYDCCIDKARLAPLLRIRARPDFCMAYDGQHKFGVYAVDTCPHNYRGSADIRSLCQESDDFFDPLVSAPVTVISTRKTYKNRYCAECNGVSPSSMESWKIYMSCETLTPLRLNDSYIWQNLKYNVSLMAWGVDLDVFHKCEVIFDKPENLTAVRFCRANTVDTCPPSYIGGRVKRLCRSYSAVVYDRDYAYKNPHCAKCNNKTATDLTCLDTSLFIRNSNKRFSFALLLDVNPRDGDRVGVITQSCPSGQKYDPFFKKCRELSCALPGYRLVEGKCQAE